MTQTLRRELRSEFFASLVSENVVMAGYSISTSEQDIEKWRKELAEKLADAALEVSAIAKRADIARAGGLDWAILSGQDVDEETLKSTKAETEATSAFEVAWGITRPWDWWSVKKEWRELLAFVVEIYQSDKDAFKRYVAWYDERGKFEGGKSAPMIQRDPTCFYAAWDMFKRQDVGKVSRQEPTEIPDWKKNINL